MGKGWIREVEGFASRARSVWLPHLFNSQSQLALHALPFVFHPSAFSLLPYASPFSLYPLPFASHNSLFTTHHLD